MYLTATEYESLTGRAAAEATTVNINIASKLLDSRIGNYGTYSSGWKLNVSSSTWYVDNFTALTEDQKNAVKLWVSGLITELFIAGGLQANQDKNLKLGRFSVSNGSSSLSKSLPESMAYYESILVSSGIVNRSVKLA